MANEFEMIGTIKAIRELQTFASGFTKREFVLTTEDNYPQAIKFECVKQQCALLDQLKPDDRVRVAFRIRGREYNDRFFVDLQAYQIEKMGADGSAVALEPELPPPADDPTPF